MIHVPIKREVVNIQIGPVMSRLAPVATHKIYLIGVAVVKEGQ